MPGFVQLPVIFSRSSALTPRRNHDLDSGLFQGLNEGACQSLGDAQTAMARAGTWLSLAAMAGYQVVNRSRSVPSRALVRVCRSRWAPCFDHCICCFLAKRRLTMRLTVGSANAVETRSPLNQRSL